MTLVNAKILVVASGPTEVEAITDSLKRSGWVHILQATGLSQALHQLVPPIPDLILLDLSLPLQPGHTWDGFQLCQQLHAHPATQGVPILVIVEMTDSEAAVRGLAAGAIDYLTKPLQPALVTARLTLHLTRHRGDRPPTHPPAMQRDGEAPSSIPPEVNLHAILDSVAASITRFRMYSQCEWEYEYCSPGYQPLFGFHPDAIAADNQLWISHVHPDDRHLVLDMAYQYVVAEQSVTREYRFFHPNGSLRWIRSSLISMRDEATRSWVVTAVETDITDRKLAEAALQESEERFRRVFEQAGLGITLADFDTGRLIKVNRCFCDMVGYSEAELLQCSWADITHPDDLTRYRHAPTSVLSEDNPSVSVEKRFVHKTGKPIWTRVTLSLVQDAHGQARYRICIVEDIQAQKQAEWALKHSEATKRAILSAMPDLMLLISAQGQHLATVSRGDLHLFGDKDYEGRTLYDYFPEPIASQRMASIQKALQTGELQVYEHQILINGELRDEESRIIALDAHTVLLIVRDITDRKQMERMLQSTTERQRAIAQIVEAIRRTLDMTTIFHVTTQELRQWLKCDRVVLYQFAPDWSGQFVSESVAPGWISLLAQQALQPDPTQSTLDQEGCIFLSPPLSGEVEDTYLKDTQGGGYSQGATHSCVEDIYQRGFSPCYIQLLEQFQARSYITVAVRQGQQIWGLLAAYQNSGPRHWHPSEVDLLIQVADQLGTALHQAELFVQIRHQAEELRLAKEQADAANRAKSEFLANMSHELRTPLNAILGFTQLLNRDSTLTPQHQEQLNIILQSGEHLLSLINGVLDMAKIESGRMTLTLEDVDLHQLLRMLEDMLGQRASSQGVDLRIERAPTVPKLIRTDEGKLRQVLINLLGNALKFTNAGHVTLKVWSEPMDVPLPPPQHHLTFEVSDTGPGIPPEDLERIFEAFVQTEAGQRSQQGTGLGLAISQRCVQLLGGTLVAESQVGAGATFRFTIPAHEIPPSTAAHPSLQRCVQSLAPGQPHRRILVVDDQKISRMLATHILVRVGFEVQEADNGQEAIALWQSWHPHLILMDIQMPVMDGYEATRQIRTMEHQGDRSPGSDPVDKTIIIALTANVFGDQHQQMQQVGCDNFVHKPFKADPLLELIGRYLGITYLYHSPCDSPDQDSPLVETPGASEVEPIDLTIMPTDWIAQLHYCACRLNSERCLSLIQQIPSGYDPLPSRLITLVNEFRFDRLIELTQRLTP